MKKEGGAILYNALIRTHHITSRKKVSKLKKEAHHDARYVLIRSGGSPGLMYIEGDERGVEEWVDAVKVRPSLPISSLSRRYPVGLTDDQGLEIQGLPLVAPTCSTHRECTGINTNRSES